MKKMIYPWATLLTAIIAIYLMIRGFAKDDSDSFTASGLFWLAVCALIK